MREQRYYGGTKENPRRLEWSDGSAIEVPRERWDREDYEFLGIPVPSELVGKGDRMSDKIVVPEGMLKASVETMVDNPVDYTGIRNLKKDITKSVSIGLEAALRWLSENPQVPTDEQIDEMIDSYSDIAGTPGATKRLIAEWQRRMFFAQESEVPEKVNGNLIGYGVGYLGRPVKLWNGHVADCYPGQEVFPTRLGAENWIKNNPSSQGIQWEIFEIRESVKPEVLLLLPEPTVDDLLRLTGEILMSEPRTTVPMTGSRDTPAQELARID